MLLRRKLHIECRMREKSPKNRRILWALKCRLLTQVQSKGVIKLIISSGTITFHPPVVVCIKYWLIFFLMNPIEIAIEFFDLFFLQILRIFSDSFENRLPFCHFFKRLKRIIWTENIVFEQSILFSSKIIRKMNSPNKDRLATQLASWSVIVNEV